MNFQSSDTSHLHVLLAAGYLLIAMLVGGIIYTWLGEWRDLERLEAENREISLSRKEMHDVYVRLTELSLLGESVLEWDDGDVAEYHRQRLAVDSILCRFKDFYEAERIDSVRHLLEDKENRLLDIMDVLEQQEIINGQIAERVPVIAWKSTQEEPKKPKRKGFLGLFGKKKEAPPTSTTTMLYTLNRDMIAQQQAQSRRLSEHADSLAARNSELNRQLQRLIRQMDAKVQGDFQKREQEITAMQERSFLTIGGLTGFVFLLLIISHIIIHRNANRIKRYKQETTDLIERLQQSVEQNEALIVSRKKAVHTIIHELRTPLTAIIGYTGLIKKENATDKTGIYVQNTFGKKQPPFRKYKHLILRKYSMFKPQ